MLSSMINSPENERGSTKLKKVQELAQLFSERCRRVPKQNINLIPADSFIKNNNIYDFRVKISIIHA